jgi:hypothetical protein
MTTFVCCAGDSGIPVLQRAGRFPRDRSIVTELSLLQQRRVARRLLD